MSLALVIDMNLSVEWVTTLAQHGWSAVHWSTFGDPRAEDSVMMAWALANDCCVFTHDLDFGTTLALTHASGPSVIQIRGQNVLPEDIGSMVIAALRQHEAALAAGALVVIDEKKFRVRVLPLEGELKDIPNGELKLTDIPPPNADWNTISDFALSFNGYKIWGTFEKCAEIGNSRLNDTLTNLRTCLFFEQRRWQHFGDDPDVEAMEYIPSVVENIRTRVADMNAA